MDQYSEIRRKALPLLKPYISRLAVFGSMVRGEATQKSDIDLLIKLKPSNERPRLGLFKLIEIEADLKKKLGQEVDLVTEYLLHILDAIGLIEEYTKGMSENEFLKLPWAKRVGIRNKIIHEYFNVNYSIVWDTIQEDLPLLKKSIKKIL